jgi:hypothetical protein
VRRQLIRYVEILVLPLALSACSEDAKRQDIASNGPGQSGPASGTATTGSMVDTSAASTTSTGSGPTGAGGSGTGGDDDASTPPGSGGSSNGSGGGGDVGDAAGGSAGCDDQQGMPATCVPPAGDAGCVSVTSYCERLGTFLKPVVHKQVASCIRGLAACDDAQAARCVKTALFGACDDRSADYTCADISSACANTVPTTIEECDVFLKGMTAPGRQAVLSCIAPTDGTPACSAGIFACVRRL